MASLLCACSGGQSIKPNGETKETALESIHVILNDLSKEDLFGVWELSNSLDDFGEIVEFSADGVEYTNYDSKGKDTPISGQYEVLDESVMLELNGHKTYLSYENDGELILTLMMDSGSDAGHKRIYRKTEFDIQETKPTQKTVDNIAVGEWKVRGIFTDDKLLDITQVDALADLYDSMMLTISQNGSFTMLNNVFVGEGQWDEIKSEEYEHVYVLKEQISYRYTFKDGKLSQTEPKESTKIYVLCITNEDNNSAILMEQNDDEKKQKDSIKIWVRSGEDSKYLEMYSSKATHQSKPKTPVADKETSSPFLTSMTNGERNALQKAKDYLEIMPFSASGLQEQLEYEGYTSSEAKFAVDRCGADWRTQAKLKAQAYLDIMSFSRDGLIDQLEYDGFTHQEAVYGVDQVY